MFWYYVPYLRPSVSDRVFAICDCFKSRDKFFHVPLFPKTYGRPAVQMRITLVFGNNKCFVSEKLQCFRSVKIGVPPPPHYYVSLIFSLHMRDLICSALRYMLEHNQGRCPVNLCTDQGNEFYNKHMKRLLDEYTDHYSTEGLSKASVSIAR